MSKELKLSRTIPYSVTGMSEPFYKNEDLEREIKSGYSSTQEMMKDIISIEHDGIEKAIYIFTYTTEKETVSIRKPLMGLEFTFLI